MKKPEHSIQTTEFFISIAHRAAAVLGQSENNAQHYFLSQPNSPWQMRSCLRYNKLSSLSVYNILRIYEILISHEERHPPKSSQSLSCYSHTGRCFGTLQSSLPPCCSEWKYRVLCLLGGRNDACKIRPRHLLAPVVSARRQPPPARRGTPCTASIDSIISHLSTAHFHALATIMDEFSS